MGKGAIWPWIAIWPMAKRHENILKIINYKGNTNENNNEIPFGTIEMVTRWTTLSNVEQNVKQCAHSNCGWV